MTTLEVNAGPVTFILMLLCTGLFFASYNVYEIFNLLKLNASAPYTLITSAFLHNGWLHFAYNMFALFFFGTALESEIGSKKTLALFFASVLLGNTFFLLMYPDSSAAGISGFIYGLMGALLLLKPKMKIFLPLGLISIPAPVFVAAPLIFVGEFFLSIIGAYSIAHIAHVGGFLTGALYGGIEKLKRRESLKYHDDESS